MANLVEVAKELEYVPEQQLAQMINDPNSRFPNFLVISEVQRRTLNDRAYQAALNEMPQTTVAQEKVAELMQPKGLAGMGAPESGLAPTTDAFSSAQPMPASTRMMSDGGKTKGLRDHMKDIVKGDYTVEDKLANYLMRGSNIPVIEDIRSKRGTFRYSNPNLLGKNSEFSINYNPREGYGGLQFLKRFKEGGSVNDRIGFQNRGYTSMGYDPYGEIPSRDSLLRTLGISAEEMTERQVRDSLLALNVPQGLVNNNPLNIKYSPDNPWLGQTGREGEFSTFQSPDYGMRAGDKVLQTYGEKYGIDNISDVITRFAPPSENDTNAYIDYVTNKIGMERDEAIDLSDSDFRKNLTSIMAEYETGYKGLEERILSDIKRESRQAEAEKPTGLQEIAARTQEQRDQFTVPDNYDGSSLPADWATRKDRWLGTYLRNKAKDYFIDDDGTINWTNTGIAAAGMIPAVRLGRLGIAAVKGIPGAARWLGGTRLGQWAGRGFTKPTQYTSAAGRRYPATSPQGQMIANLSRNPNVAARGFSPLRTAETLSYMGLGAAAYDQLSDLGEEQTKGEVIVDKNNNNGEGNEIKVNSTVDSQTQVAKKIDSYMDQVSGLDMAKLGGIIMSARNTSELGEGLAGLASDMQTRLTEKEARENTQALQEIQAGLYKAQTDKYKADVANMEPQQLVAVMESIEDMLKLAYETGDPSSPEVIELQSKYESAYKRWADIMGISYTTKEQSDADLLKSVGVSVSGQ
jgi:hypothetical protein